MELERIELWRAHPDLDTADLRRYATALRLPLAYRAGERVAYVAPILRPVGPYAWEARLLDFGPANAAPGDYGAPERLRTAYRRLPSKAWAEQTCERFVLTGQGMPPVRLPQGEPVPPGCARVGARCDGGCPCES